MRISSAQLHQLNLNSIMTQFAKVSHTQQQISTGKRIIDPSDDPLGKVEGMRLRKVVEETELYQKNIDTADGRLRLTESLLGDAQNVLQRVRELSIQAANASQNEETRGFIAREMRENLDNLFQLANIRDGADSFLFAGFQNSQPPFSKAAGGVVYNGDEGQRRVQIGQQRTIADGNPGSDVFMKIRDGNGSFATFADNANTGQALISEGVLVDPSLYDKDDYRLVFTAPVIPGDPIEYEIYDSAAVLISGPTPYVDDQEITFGRGIRFIIKGPPQVGDVFDLNASRNESVFDVLEGMAQALEQTTVTDVQKNAQLNDINHFLSGIDRVIDNFTDIRTSLGARLNVIEAQRSVNDGTKILMEELVSGVEDVDIADAISRFSQHMTSLEAAQKTYVRMQDLSVFNYL